MGFYHGSPFEQKIVGLLFIILLPVTIPVWAVVMLWKGTRWVWKRMAQLTTYDVHAAIMPDGKVERTNTLSRKTFGTIHKVYQRHDDWRWLVVNQTGYLSYYVIDLWQTESDEDFPYEKPFFVDPYFDDIDQAIGFVNMNLVS